MPNLKISQLNAGNPAQSGDFIPIDRAGVNFKITADSIAALIPPSSVFNVLTYGADPTGVNDSTTAFNNALTAAYTAGGGTIFFPVGTYLIAGQINIPNDGSTTFNNSPLQPSFRITGAASSGGKVPGGGSTPVPWDGSIAYGGSILNMTYNSATAKIATFGEGPLEIDHLTLADNSTDTATFFFTSNTTVNIHDVTFLGTTVGSSPTNDAIWLGNNFNTPNGTFNAPYQGYGSIITHCYFQNIKRALFIQCFGNSVDFSENTIWSSCGNPTGGAIEVGCATAGGSEANNIVSNLIEATHYKYGIWNHSTATKNKYIGNDVWDTGVNFVAAVQLDSGGNIVVGGFDNSLPLQYVAGVGVVNSTYMSLGGTGLTLPNAQVLGWNDTALSRLSAKSIALGNGTADDITASLTLANATLENAVAAQSASPALVTTALAQESGGHNPSVAVNTIGSTLLVAVLGGFSTSHQTLSDSASNSWNYLTPYETSGGWIVIAYAYGITTSAAHTFTLPATANADTWAQVYAFSGTLTTSSVFDVAAGRANQASPATPTSITPTSGDVVISGIMEAGTITTASVNSGFNTPAVVVTGKTYNGATSYLLNASGAPLNPSWTYSGGADVSVAIASFKAAPGITNENSPTLTLQGTVWDSAGPSSISDVWTIQDVIAQVEDGASTLTFTHTGSTGVAAVQIPQLDIGGTDTGISRISAGILGIGNGTAGDITGSIQGSSIALNGAVASPTAGVYYSGTNAGITQTAEAVGTLATTGGIVTTFTAVSDERLKVFESTKYGLAEILAITPITYRWNDLGQKYSGQSTERDFVGFSAQNVKQVIPEAVWESKDGYFGFDDRPVIAALVNAVKTLEARIRELEK